MKRVILTLIALSATFLLFGQSKTNKDNLKNPTSTPRSLESISISNPYPAGIPSAARTIFNGSPIKFQPKSILPGKTKEGLQIAEIDAEGQVISIKGKLTDNGLRTGSIKVQAEHYLAAAAPLLKIKNPSEEFELKKQDTDDLGMTHLRFEQRFEGLKVYNSEIILHSKNDVFFMLNGRVFPSPNIKNTTPQVTDKQALIAVEKHLTEVRKEIYEKNFDTKYLGTEQIKKELIIYFYEKEKKGSVPNLFREAKLAWHFTIHPNLMKRFEYFTDAQSGEILHSFAAFCQFTHLDFKGKEKHNCEHHKSADKLKNSSKTISATPPPGPEEANATDLNGQTRRIQTYLHNGTFFMIDAAKPMHNASGSVWPNDASGVIWTIDGQNGTPARPNSFQATHVTSGNNSWNDRRAVSAHYNAEQAYLYFLNTHQRNSINDANGNIMSFFNIAEQDGSDMDNAFWNGAGIFYGNGNVAFNNSLAKALDVAGHEMTHGVVQTTANLNYEGESGALNESFADIFAAMMDRNDWKIGEDVVNPLIFPTGAMRDMSDPHNGGNSLNDDGWQPAHYNERYIGSEDNGGVHINSGIPNHAFYRFATHSAVGREKAEKVFYRALDKYLVRSSQFVDLRTATLQSVQDLNYGADVNNALVDALNAVGIPGGSGNDYQNDFEENPGEGFLIMTDVDETAIYLADETGALVGNPFINIAPLSRVSITDDGTFAYFIGDDKTMYQIDFGANVFRQIDNREQWVNIAVSKDGSKLAALTDDNDNSIWVYDFATQNADTFYLYNPTFSAGVATGDVVYPDVIEWDYSGEWLMYDALNRLQTTFGEIEYWDIGFINVWDNAFNTFAGGDIQKLYSVTPENTDIGNPTFSKNSPYIISFDYRDNNNGGNHDLLTANLETGDVSDPLFRNSDWNFPNFDLKDKNLTFNAQTNGGDDVIAIMPLTDDKLSAAGNAGAFVTGGSKGVWFGNGTRNTSSTESVDYEEFISVFPNPATDELTVEIEISDMNIPAVEIYDLTGRKLLIQPISFGKNFVSVSDLPEGSYFVSVKESGKVLKTNRVVVLR